MTNPRPQFTARTVEFRAPGPLAQILSIAIFLAIVALAFFILIPVAVALLVIGLIVYIYFRIKLAFRRAKGPNGPLDGRHNVRVVQRDD